MRFRRWLTFAAFLPPILLGVVAMAGWLYLRASLPRLDGRIETAGLAGPVSIARDARGVPTITAGNRTDLAYATGYAHAQDRFFQMDLLRRSAAGELAALVGSAALGLDRDRRPHQFRARARAVFAGLPVDERTLLERYGAGVNDGLAGLSSRPFEYGLLMTAPEPWKPEDSLLVGWAMYFDLQGNFGRELGRTWIRDHADDDQLSFLLPESSPWDAPLDAPPLDVPMIAPRSPAPPTAAPAWWGRRPRHAGATDIPGQDDMVGSNNWAVAGGRTGRGGAIVADDMHLGLMLPNSWYRALLIHHDDNGKERRLAGVTLPGLPALIAGSNGHVAWGFTNSYGDYFDLVELELDPAGAPRYRTEDGNWAPIERTTETIAVKGAPPQRLVVLTTDLGPVWQIGGKAYAMRWIAHDRGAIDLGMLAFEKADDLASLLDAANRAGLPAQNMVAGDDAGHIGWTIAGPLPNRRWRAADGFAYPSTARELGWRSLAAPADHPRRLDPPDGQLWTANSRQLAGADYARLGDGGADIGARARQIRDDLSRLDKAREEDVLAIGLDDRALFLAPWRERMLAVLSGPALDGHPARAEVRRLLLAEADLRADPRSVAYRLVHDMLGELYTRVFAGLDDALADAYGTGTVSFRSANPRWPHVLARLIDERPEGWLPQGAGSWPEVELAAIDAEIAAIEREGTPLTEANWGRRNRARIQHPFARILPPLARWLSAPADPLPGDANMPRVAGPAFGQSERMAISPGHEEQALFAMPGGQSGHPLSPYFLAGHAEWVRGMATPLLPGPAVHILTLEPRS